MQCIKISGENVVINDFIMQNSEVLGSPGNSLTRKVAKNLIEGPRKSWDFLLSGQTIKFNLPIFLNFSKTYMVIVQHAIMLKKFNFFRIKRIEFLLSIPWSFYFLVLKSLLNFLEKPLTFVINKGLEA